MSSRSRDRRAGKHSDGNGLYLRITSNGTRSWIVILIGDGRRREMGLGVPDEVSLAQARKLAADAKAAFAEGRDIVETIHLTLETMPANATNW